MTAGFNCKATLIRINYSDDDTVGGAVITGTAVYNDILMRMQAQPEEQLLLQQGLETQRTFTANILPGFYDVRERDELEINQPTDHPYYAVRFRITGVRYSDHNRRDPRNYIMVSMVRSVRAHDSQ